MSPALWADSLPSDPPVESYIKCSKGHRRKSAQVFLFESCGGEMLIQIVVRVMKETAECQNLYRSLGKFFSW